MKRRIIIVMTLILLGLGGAAQAEPKANDPLNTMLQQLSSWVDEVIDLVYSKGDDTVPSSPDGDNPPTDELGTFIDPAG